MILHRINYSGWWKSTHGSMIYAFRGPRARWIRISPHLHLLRHRGTRTRHRLWMYPMATLLVGGAGYIAYQNHQPFRHTYLAAIRCWRVASAFSVCCPYDFVHILFMFYAGATILGVIDYKFTFAWKYEDENQRSEAVSLCHSRSAKRVFKALLTNGGM